MQSGPLFATNTFLWALAAMCQVHRRPFAPSLILQQFPPPYGPASLQEAAAALKLKSGFRAADTSEFESLPAPFLAVLKPDTVESLENDSSDTRSGLAMVLQSDATKIYCLKEKSNTPSTVAIADFDLRYAGLVLLCTPQTAPPAAEDPLRAPSQPFGFRWFIPELIRYRTIWRDVLIASFMIQVVALAAPLCTQVIIDKVVVHQTVNTLIVIGFALTIFVVFNAAMSWVRQYLVLHTGNRVDSALGTRAFEHLLSLPMRYFENRPTGVLVARLHGVETIREFVSGAAISLLLDLPFLFIFLGIMFYYSALLTLITLGVLGVIIALSLGIVPAIRNRLNQQFLLGARNAAFLTEYVSGMETVKSLQMEPQLRGRFGGYLASYLDAGLKTRQLSNTYNVAATALEQALTFATLGIGAWLVMQNDGFTIGMLVAYQMLESRRSQPMLRLVALWQEFQQAVIAVRRLGDIMNAPAEPYSIVPMRSGLSGASIEVTDLAFRYSDEHPLLYKNLEFKVESGSSVAILGPSGSGKSTLAKLMQGFYLPTEGRIRVGERDARHLSANELRHNFGVVPQDTMLFSGTIYENLVLANPHATLDMVVHACRMAEIHETIEALTCGYQAQIGEHGVGLSGGQKQRLAIARALLKRPKILIFDEATSNLDERTAEQFASTINRLKGKVTVLFIAHQLPKSLRIDQVIRLGRAA
ncbi:MAG: peptidase domain-containing ABC transporter [Burkholderiales bacterium]